MNLSFLNQNPDITTTNEFDYNSFYRAVVMGIDDPQHLGRIKVKIPALHSTTNNYPYAYPAIQAGMGNQVGQFILPPIGSIVFVGFEYGDEHRIIYFGGVPTTYVEGKEQSYGTDVLSGTSRKVTNNDIPTEYTGSQAILYKSPVGQILFMDSYTYNRRVYLGAENGQALLMQTTLNDATDYSETNIVKLQYNDGSYIIFDNDGEEDKFHLFLNGEEVELGGGDEGTTNYNKLKNRPQVNGITLEGNLSLEDLGIHDAILTFTRNNQTIGTFSANSNRNVTIDIPSDVQLDYLTAQDIDDIYNNL